jgi:isoleucyl-tRNA synthetase
VPIPAIDCRQCGEAIMTAAIVERTAAVFEQHGADAWYELPVEAFVPEDLACPACGGTAFDREANILDVWFDSGSSHEGVLARRPGLTWPADMYLEGSDQHRGWFHSSLLVGLGTRGRAPYRLVLTHGFVVDGDGRKMSKSLGNTVEPQEVIARSGAEILRLWVAMVDYREEIRLSKEILARVVEVYRKLRNTLRYLVANLYDFDPDTDAVAAGQMLEVDRYALASYAAVARKVVRAYEEFDYPAAMQGVNALATVELSAFYFDVSKDRLYTFGPASAARRSAQTAMATIADGLVRLMAVVLPVTSDELWQHLPGRREPSVHLADFPGGLDLLDDPELTARWEQLRSVRDTVNAAIEVVRQQKLVGTSLEAHVHLRADGDLYPLLERYRDDLPMLFIVSRVSLERDAPGRDEPLSVAVSRAEGMRCTRCWRYVPSVASDDELVGLCERCVEAVSEPAGAGSR